MTSTHNIHFYGKILTKVFATHTYVSSLFIDLPQSQAYVATVLGYLPLPRKRSGQGQ